MSNGVAFTPGLGMRQSLAARFLSSPFLDSRGSATALSCPAVAARRKRGPVCTARTSSWPHDLLWDRWPGIYCGLHRALRVRKISCPVSAARPSGAGCRGAGGDVVSWAGTGVLELALRSAVPL